MKPFDPNIFSSNAFDSIIYDIEATSSITEGDDSSLSALLKGVEANSRITEGNDTSRDDSVNFTVYPKIANIQSAAGIPFQNSITVTLNDLKAGQTVLITVYQNVGTLVVEPTRTPDDLTYLGVSEYFQGLLENAVFLFRYDVTEDISQKVWSFTKAAGTEGGLNINATVYTGIKKIYPVYNGNGFINFSTTSSLTVNVPRYSTNSIIDNAIVYVSQITGYGVDSTSMTFDTSVSSGIETISFQQTAYTNYFCKYPVIEHYGSSANSVFKYNFSPSASTAQLSIVTFALTSYSFGDVAITEGDDTVNSTNFTVYELNANLTEDNDSVASTAIIYDVAANASISEEDDNMSSLGLVFDLPTTPRPATLIAWATGTSVASIPTTPQNAASYEPDDLIIVFAYRDGNTTPPTLNGNFSTIRGVTGNNTNSERLASRRFQSGDESATWTFTNATSVITLVYRNVASIGASNSTGGASTTPAIASLTLSNTSGFSKKVAFIGHRSNNVTFPAVTDWTKVAEVSDTTDEAAAYETNNLITSDTSPTVSVGGTSSGWRTASVELISDVANYGIVFINEDDDTLSTAPMVYAELSINDGDDTSNSSANISIASAASITEGVDTSTATAGVAIKSNSSISESSDTVSATSGVSIRSNASIGEGGDSVASTSGVAVRATASISENNDSVVGRIEPSLGVSVTEQDDRVSSIAVAYEVSYEPLVISLNNSGFIDNTSYSQIWAVVYAATKDTDSLWFSNYISNLTSAFNSSPVEFTLVDSVTNVYASSPETKSIARIYSAFIPDGVVVNLDNLPSVQGVEYVYIKNGTVFAHIGDIFPNSPLLLSTNIVEGYADKYRTGIYALGFTGNDGTALPDFTTSSSGYIEKSVNFVSASGGWSNAPVQMYDSYHYQTTTLMPTGQLNSWTEVGPRYELSSDTNVGPNNYGGHIVTLLVYENIASNVGFVAPTEDDDSLSSFNYNRGFFTNTEVGDSLTFTSLLNVRGVDQTEQDDIAVAFGYHFDAPQPVSSIEFLGYTVTTSGNAITFPAGIQDGDFVIAVGNSVAAEFDYSWNNWVTTSPITAIAKYSPSISLPVVTSDVSIYAFRGVDFVDSFPFGAPLQPSNISIEGNTVFYGSYASVGANNLLDLTEYFKVFYTDTAEGLTASLLSDFGTRVVHNFSSGGRDFIIVIDGESNEPTQSVVSESFGNYVQAASTSEILPTNYGPSIAVGGRGFMLLPISITSPEGSSRAEILEEDDQLIRGAPIHARLTEDDDYVLDSYAYSFEAPRLIGAELIESTYVNAVDLPNIVFSDNELIVLVLDVNQTTLDGGGYWNVGNYPSGWDGNTPNMLFAHTTSNPNTFPDESAILNGAYLYRFTNVLYDDYYNPRSNGDYGNFYGDYYTVSRTIGNNPARPNSEKAPYSTGLRINILDYTASPVGITSADLQTTLADGENVFHGTMTGAPDRIFSVDILPVVAGSNPDGPTVDVDDSEFFDFSSTIVGGEKYEFLTILFQPNELVIYGNNTRVEAVEEDDITTVGDLLFSRNYEDDDFVSESFGYQYPIGIETSIETVGVDVVGYTNSFTLSSSVYNEGDLIYVYFTPDDGSTGGSSTIIENFVNDYPEFYRHSNESSFTDFLYPMFFGLVFDGITKTYTMSSDIHITIIAYRGVLDNRIAPTYNYNSGVTGYVDYDTGSNYAGRSFYPFMEYEYENSALFENLKTLIRYPTFVYFGTANNPSDSSAYPVELFSTAFSSATQVVYDVDVVSSSDTFTTFVFEEKPLSVNYFEGEGGTIYAETSASAYVTFEPSALLVAGSIFLVPAEVTFNSNRAELFEENDSIEAVLEKGGTEANLSVTEADDSISSATKLALVSTLTRTEANDTIAATSSAPVKATFAKSEQDDFINSTSSAPVKATATLSEANDAVSATSVISLKATATITESSDTSGATATISVKANASRTEANDTIASASSVLVKANSANNEGNDSISSTASAPAKATAVLTETDDTGSSTAVLPLKASVTITEQGDTFESVTSGKTPLYAVMTEADDTGSSTGIIWIKAIASIAEADDTPSGTSKIPVVGTLVTIEENDSVQAASTILVKATASNTEQGDSISAASKILIRSSTSVTEQDDVSTSATKLALVANSSNNEESDSVSVESAILIKANSSNNEESDLVSAESAILIKADSSHNEQDDTFASAGVLPLKSNMSASEGDDSVASSSRIAILSAVVANEQDDYLKSIVLRTIPAFTDFVATSDFAPIANRIRYSAASFEAAAELYGLGLKTITIAVEMTADSDFETIQTRTRNAFIQFESTFDFSAISIPVPGTTYRIVYVIAEINRVNVDASMNTEDVLGLANEEFVLVEKV